MRGTIDALDGNRTIQLIGEPALTGLYARALERFDVTATIHDGAECAIAGLRRLIGPND